MSHPAFANILNHGMTKAQLTQFLGRVPLCGRALRWWANHFTEDSVVRIDQGHAAGFLWKRHHRYVNGYWIGHYELPIQDALVSELSEGDTFFDVGANAGFFTLVAARKVGPRGRCVAFDPSPHNHASIREQIELNGLTNCQAVMEAIAERDGKARFCFSAPGSPTGHLGASQEGEAEVEVRLTTLDLAIGRFGVPSMVKMDIEGAEVLALKGAAELLRKARPRWLIELHGAACAEGVKAILRGAGYSFFWIDGSPVTDADTLPHHVITRVERG